MESISVFLGKYSFLNSTPKRVTEVSRALSTLLGISIPEECIKISHGNLFVSVHPAIRTELLLNLDSVRTALREVLSDWLFEIR